MKLKNIIFIKKCIYYKNVLIIVIYILQNFNDKNLQHGLNLNYKLKDLGDWLCNKIMRILKVNFYLNR